MDAEPTLERSGERIARVEAASWPDALALLYGESIRGADAVAAALAAAAKDPDYLGGLFGLYDAGSLRHVSWAQLLPGSTASLWANPDLTPGGSAERLLTTAAEFAKGKDVSMVQALLDGRSSALVQSFKAVGFVQLAELLFMVCTKDHFPSLPTPTDLYFDPYHPQDEERWVRLVDRTYMASLDCPGVNGVRRTLDVLEGYRAVGRFKAEHWLIARRGGEDLGCVMIAEHAERTWEIVYMGVVPEARGAGLGRELCGHAMQLAARANADLAVVAVDSQNEPAVRLYESLGFVAWDQRQALVQICGGKAI